MNIDINNPMDILWGNSHLAFYLGAKETLHHSDGQLFELDIAGFRCLRTTQELKFHKDWNWMIAVLIRIAQTDRWLIEVAPNRSLEMMAEFMAVLPHSELSNRLLSEVWKSATQYVISKYSGDGKYATGSSFRPANVKLSIV
jgi:hypothetical protein